MNEFIKTLTEEQKRALLKALSGGSFDPEVPNQHEEPISEAVDGDFTMKQKDSLTSRRRSPVKAGENQWTDQGECRGKDVETPKIKPTPRNRKPPRKKSVTCHVCGKSTKVNANFVHGEFYRCDKCSGTK